MLVLITHLIILFIDIYANIRLGGNGNYFRPLAKELETSGIIKSYHAQIDREKVGLGVMTFVQVSLAGHRKAVSEAFVEKISTVPEIIECHHVTGSCDFLLKVIAKDINSYQKLIMETINEIEEVASTQTMVILSTFKDTQVLPVP